MPSSPRSEPTAARPRFATLATDGRSHRLAAVEAVAVELGTPLMPWQREAVAVITEHDDGRPYFPTAVVTVPRQSGKSVLAAALIVELARREPLQRIAYTAQTRGDAARRLTAIGNTLALAGVDCRVTRGIGNERLAFPNGSEVFVISPNATGGHGESLDLVVADELWAVDPIVMQGIVPAQAARPNSQLIGISTMGTTDSKLLLDLVGKGREAVAEDRRDGIAYIEYSAGDDDDPFDPAVWAECSPALGHTIAVDSIAGALEVLAPNEFIRAYTNRLVESNATEIPREWWQRTERAYTGGLPDGLTIGIDLGVGPDSAALAAAWPTDGDTRHTELVEYRRGAPGWIIPRLRELVARFDADAVVFDAVGPARLLEVELAAACEELRVDLRIPRSGEVAVACHRFYDGLRTGDLTHGIDQPLDLAVAGVVRRTFGDSWAWSRQRSTYDISPLMAAALASWAVAERQLTPRPTYAAY